MKRLLFFLALLCLSATAAFAQGGRITSDPVALSASGRPIGGANVAICAPLATTAASVTGNLALFTMASNPITAGFIQGMTVQVAGFTGGDTYFNAGTLANGTITSGLTILSVTSTQVIAALTHANASASTNGTLLQMGNAVTSCAGLSTLYTDASLVTTTPNPFTTDGLGNYGAGVASGIYYTQIYGPGVTTTLRQISVGGSSGAGTIVSGITGNIPKYTGPTTVGDSLVAIGSLTSTTVDNQFTAAQRFKGPIPWRDITAYMPAGGCPNDAASTNREIGTINSGSAALTLTYDNGFKNGCGIFVANAGAASTLLTPAQGSAAAPFVPTGQTTGATTIHYKVAAIDANYGTSAASAAMTIANAPATRSEHDYVVLNWQGVANAIGYLVYTDQTGGGTYVPLTYSFDCNGFTAGPVCGAVDKGAETNTWTGFLGMWPTTPPASVTNQALITTIVSGGGTDNLVLAATATNTATTVFTFPDNSPFIKSALADASTDGNSANRGIVYIPVGEWFVSSFVFPSSGSTGVKIILNGTIELFGLPIDGPLSGGGSNSGNIAIDGTGGMYKPNNWATTCSQISGYSTLGAVFALYSGELNLSHICISAAETGIVSGPGGGLFTRDSYFGQGGSGPDWQIDNNAFFSKLENTNWNGNAGANGNVPQIWFLGLTNAAHSSVFEFESSTFIAHTMQVDQAFVGGGPTGNMVFSGYTDIESNFDPCFICLATNNSLGGVGYDNVTTGDANTAQTFIYSYVSEGELPGQNNTIRGQTVGFSVGLVGAATPSVNATDCQGWTYESPQQGGAGIQSIGYYGSIFGKYSGCDFGITQTGYDVQTTEVLTSGGNDTNGPAGEQMLGHIIRRPRTTLTDNGAGALAAATYYVKVTMLDVAGRESAPSPEVSLAVAGSHSIAVSAISGIYFPTSCNVYFGTAAGSEPNYFNSTTVTNGTCTYTLTTIAGETLQSPPAVGNAMRSWLSEENNANSCLFCGLGGGLGTGFLGFNLTAAQYGAPPTGAKLFLNGGFAASSYITATNCAGKGTAASPSVASCGSAAAGHFSCDPAATGATCQVNTTAVTANSEIFVFESDTTVTGTALGVTCNTGTTVIPTSRILASSVAATSFTINLGTVTTNPACFSYWIVN